MPNASALDDSAAKGCEFCSLIRAVLSRVPPEPSGSARNTAFTLSLARVDRREGLWLHWSGDVNDGIEAALRTERDGALEDRHGRMHLFVAPGMMGSMCAATRKNMARRLTLRFSIKTLGLRAQLQGGKSMLVRIPRPCLAR